MSNAKATDNEKYIIVNSVYTGRYGFDRRNLPHEVINFFRADDDRFYVFITSHGDVNKELHIEKIRAILFVRNAGNSLAEVLAKAEIGNDQTDENDFPVQGISLTTDGSVKGAFAGIPSFPDVKYGGKTLQEIHAENASDNGINATMRVKSISLPKKSFYLTHDLQTYNSFKESGLGHIFLVKKKVTNQSMKTYFSEKSECPESYKTLLKEIIENEELWKPVSDTKKYGECKNGIQEEKSFFDVTLQQNNEVMFSNMLFYYFSVYPELAKDFIRTISGGEIDLENGFTVEREKERMDIRLIDKSSYIIIENKIKSQINGIGKKIDHDKDGKIISQLSKYYEKAEKQNRDNEKERAIYGFVFAPDYSAITEKLLIDKYSYGNKYKVIHYSKICDYFERVRREGYQKEIADDKYIRDFIIALKKHTEPVDDDFRKELLLRFKYRIESEANKS